MLIIKIRVGRYTLENYIVSVTNRLLFPDNNDNNNSNNNDNDDFQNALDNFFYES